MTDSSPFAAFVIGPIEPTEIDTIRVLESGSIGKVSWNICEFPSRRIAMCSESLEYLRNDSGVTIQVDYSALNFKDALAASGHPGVAKRMPLIPGIDAAGTVVDSDDSRFQIGDQVMIAHAKFGTANHGGWTRFVKVPGDWVYQLPKGLTKREAVIWGTAGFTAAQSVYEIVQRGIEPEQGPVLVTGATGGVGIFSVKLLHQLGYQVVASTGKADRAEWLSQQGASEVVGRDDVVDTTESPLLKGQWAAAVDTVGGNTLASVLRSAKPHACVTACGLVAGHELNMTVYPFILRGVTLCGIDSAGISRSTREMVWSLIGEKWKLPDLDSLTEEIPLSGVPAAVEKILAGNVAGRTVVNLDSTIG